MGKRKKETKSRNREEIKAAEEKKGEESKSIPKAAARDKPHGEEKKKETKSRKQREEVKAAEEKKERDLTLTSVM